MALAFPVTVTGAEVAERALGRVGDAAVQAERRTQSAGRGVASFASQTEKLDKVVDAVEKPMRALNGALDIASVALGVGLAGPLGVVIGQFGDLVKAAYAAIEVTAPYERATNDAATAATALAAAEAEAAKQIRTRTEAQKAAGQSAVSRAVGTIGAGLDAATLDRILLAGQRLEAVTQQRAALIAGLQPGRTTAAQVAELDALTRSLDSAQAELRALGADGAQVITQATEASTKASTARVAAVRAEVTSLEGIRKALTAIDPLVTRAGEDVRTARLVAGVESGRVPVTDGLFPSSRSTSDVLSQGADAFGPEPVAQMVAKLGEIPPQATAAEASLLSLSAASADLGSLGVAGLQQFSAAAGQALGSLIIGGDGTSKSLKRIAGEVTSSLAISALSYATYLTALGIAASLSGGLLGLFAAPLFTAAKTMAVTGVALGLTARALGAGSSPGGGGARSGAGGGGGGGGDRVGSLSSGRPGGAQPVMVTVVLGVEQVTSVLVDGARREARAGGLSGGRLAVA
jgi:hypothetical protein